MFGAGSARPERTAKVPRALFTLSDLRAGGRRIDIERVREDLAGGRGAHEGERRAELGETHRVQVVERAAEHPEEDGLAREQAARPLGGEAEGLARLRDAIDPLLQAPRRAEVPDGRGDDQQVAPHEGVEQEVEGGEVVPLRFGERAVVGGVEGGGALAGEVERMALGEDIQLGEGERGARIAEPVQERVGEAPGSRAPCGGGGRARNDEVNEQGRSLDAGQGRRGTIRSPRWTISFDSA